MSPRFVATCGTFARSHSAPVETIAEQIEDIYRRRVLRAREMDPMEKIFDGPRLFEEACRRMRAGAEDQVGREGAEAEFRRRLEIGRILARRDRQ